MTPKTIVVVDLDGTLANVNHRTHYIRREKPKWDEFFRRAHKDRLNEWCKVICNSSYWTTVIVSARPEYTRHETEKWLRENGVVYSKLFLLRGDDDNTPDQELKRAWLKKFGKRKILFVVDDRQKVVDMWREEGVVCLQCYAWPEYKVDRTSEQVVSHA